MLTETQELALALELLEVSSEADLEQFLGKVFKSIGKVAKGLVKGPLGGVLKSIAKKALPFIGGALGSFIPIPGVGTALGTALGSAASKALETEMQGVDRELPGQGEGRVAEAHHAGDQLQEGSEVARQDHGTGGRRGGGAAGTRRTGGSPWLSP